MFSAFDIQFRCEVSHFDVSSFFYCGLRENVFVEQPPGFEIAGKGSKFLCKLLKGLPELK